MKIVIYGTGKFAEFVSYVFSQDAAHEVVGFCIEKEFREVAINSCQNIDIIEFERLEQFFPPNDYSLFVSVGNNWARERIFNNAKLRGYSLFSYISPGSISYPDLTYGENVFVDIASGLHPFCTIGDNTILLDAKVGHHCRIGSNVLLSGCHLAGGVSVGNNTFIGMNASIQQNVQIASNTIIGMGCTITSDTIDGDVYSEKPSRRRQIRADAIKTRYL